MADYFLSLPTICSNVNNKLLYNPLQCLLSTYLTVSQETRLNLIFWQVLYILNETCLHITQLFLAYYILCFVHDREKMSFKCITI